MLDKRDAALHSDVRAGREARLRARTFHRLVVRQARRLLIALALAGLVTTALAAAAARTAMTRGFVIGACLTATVAAGAHFVSLLGGTGPLIMGEIAEQWTAQSLRSLRAHGWKLANHVLLTRGDADHVLVGPDGVTVVETKWRREPWRTNGRDFDRDAAVAQAEQSARSLGLLLGHEDVRSVVVPWWGAAAAGQEAVWPKPKRFGATLIVPGPLLDDWALRRGRSGLSPGEVEALWARVRKHALSNAEWESRHKPVPRSIEALAWAWAARLLLAILGFFAVVEVLSTTGSLVVWAITALAALGAAAALRRNPASSYVNAFVLGAWLTIPVAAYGVARSALG